MLETALPKFLGDFHPILLHYTVSFLTVAALCDLVQGRWPTERVAYWCYIFGTVMCVPTILCGIVAAGNFAPHDPYLNYHRYLGFGMLAIASLQALYRVGVFKGIVAGRQLAFFGGGVLMLITVVLVGETGGILTRGKTPFYARQRVEQQVSLGGSPSVPPDIGEALVAVEPYLEKNVNFSHVDKVFHDRHCIDCHAEMGHKTYPLNMHESELGSIEWLPARDDLTPESIGFCQLYQALILDNRMPPPLDDENHAGMPLSERLLILQFLKNLPSLGALSSGEESQASE